MAKERIRTSPLVVKPVSHITEIPVIAKNVFDNKVLLIQDLITDVDLSLKTMKKLNSKQVLTGTSVQGVSDAAWNLMLASQELFAITRYLSKTDIATDTKVVKT